jgi:hypothetical protein
MKKFRRIIEVATLMIYLVTLSVSNLQAQTCGGGFMSFEISDSEGKRVPNITIEVVAELTGEEYGEVQKNNPIIQRYNIYKIPERDAAEIVKRRKPMNVNQDFCGNPLRQLANSTKVKKWLYGKPDAMNFGFCVIETYQRPLLLKISAPRYLSDYYVGPFLGGCGGGTHKFVLAIKK